MQANSTYSTHCIIGEPNRGMLQGLSNLMLKVVIYLLSGLRFNFSKVLFRIYSSTPSSSTSPSYYHDYQYYCYHY